MRNHFNICFGKAGPKAYGRRLFLMDNDPSQTRKKSLSALLDIECQPHEIPPRSPDLNPIENVFHLVKTSLEREAINKNMRPSQGGPCSHDPLIFFSLIPCSPQVKPLVL